MASMQAAVFLDGWKVLRTTHDWDRVLSQITTFAWASDIGTWPELVPSNLLRWLSARSGGEDRGFNESRVVENRTLTICYNFCVFSRISSMPKVIMLLKIPGWNGWNKLIPGIVTTTVVWIAPANFFSRKSWLGVPVHRNRRARAVHTGSTTYPGPAKRH